MNGEDFVAIISLDMDAFEVSATIFEWTWKNCINPFKGITETLRFSRFRHTARLIFVRWWIESRVLLEYIRQIKNILETQVNQLPNQCLDDQWIATLGMSSSFKIFLRVISNHKIWMERRGYERERREEEGRRGRWDVRKSKLIWKECGNDSSEGGEMKGHIRLIAPARLRHRAIRPRHNII